MAHMNMYCEHHAIDRNDHTFQGRKWLSPSSRWLPCTFYVPSGSPATVVRQKCRCTMSTCGNEPPSKIEHWVKAITWNNFRSPIDFGKSTPWMIKIQFAELRSLKFGLDVVEYGERGVSKDVDFLQVWEVKLMPFNADTASVCINSQSGHGGVSLIGEDIGGRLFDTAKRRVTSFYFRLTRLLRLHTSG